MQPSVTDTAHCVLDALPFKSRDLELRLLAGQPSNTERTWSAPAALSFNILNLASSVSSAGAGSASPLLTLHKVLRRLGRGRRLCLLGDGEILANLQLGRTVLPGPIPLSKLLSAIGLHPGSPKAHLLPVIIPLRAYRWGRNLADFPSCRRRTRSFSVDRQGNPSRQYSRLRDQRCRTPQLLQSGNRRCGTSCRCPPTSSVSAHHCRPGSSLAAEAETNIISYERRAQRLRRRR